MTAQHIRQLTGTAYTNATGTQLVTIFNSNGNPIFATGTNCVQPQDWNSLHNVFYSLAGNTNSTFGASTVSGAGGIVMAASGNVSVSGSSNTFAVHPPMGSYYLAQAANIGGASKFNNAGAIPNNGNSICAPLQMPYAMSLGFARYWVGGVIAQGGTNVTKATTANTSTSGGDVLTIYAGIFSCPWTGASSNSWYSVISGTSLLGFNAAISAGTAGSVWTMTYNISYCNVGNTTVSSFTYSTSSTNWQGSVGGVTSGWSNFIGDKYIDIPITGTLAKSNYAFLLGVSDGGRIGDATMNQWGVSCGYYMNLVIGTPPQLANPVDFGSSIDNATSYYQHPWGSIGVGAAFQTNFDASNVGSNAVANANYMLVYALGRQA